jgi:protein ImuB
LRTLCVWFPEWPLIVLEKSGPGFVYEEGRAAGGETARVAAANNEAIEAGVAIGMGRRAAEALCPVAETKARDLGAETRLFETVLHALEDLIPRVEVVEPGLVLIATEGAVRYYGGEDVLVDKVEGIAGPGARIGVADGPFAARWAARTAREEPQVIDDDIAFLASLDIAAIGREEMIDTFRWLGLNTLGALAELPREAVASRFGNEGLCAHRLASGEDRSVNPRSIPAHLAVEAHYDDPLESLDQVGFSARALSARLMNGLRREGLAPYRVEIEAESATGKVRQRVWRSTDPFLESTLVERVWWQLRAWIDQEGIEGGLVRLRLDPSDLSGAGRQLALLEVAGDGWEGYDATRPEAERALARVQALVGPDAVLQARSQGGRMPSEQVHWFRLGEEPGAGERDPEAPWPSSTPGPAPSLVPPEPEAIDIEWDEGLPIRIRLGSRWEPILNWAGPWRLLGRWWRGEGAGDRYQIVTSAGAFLIVTDGTRSYLAGIYD